jgi:hypothetical protein
MQWRASAPALARRSFLAAAFAAPAALAATKQKDERHRFRTGEVEIELSLRYHDAYSSQGFWFRDQGANREFCLSSNGQQNKMCMENFRGSLVLARYQVKVLSKKAPMPGLREYVRTIDRDARLDQRPPFERAIRLEHGVASDVQAFGYEAPQGTPPIPPTHGPWYLFRQDLFLEPQKDPFLVLYWKQALPSIRILDMIPGDQTSVIGG